MLHHASICRVAAVAGLVFATAGGVAGQACLGLPIQRSEFAVGGAAGFTDGATSFGGGIGANLRGPLAFRFDAAMTSYDEVDPNGVGFGGLGAYELPVAGASVCPLTGIGYFRVSDTMDQLTGTLSQVTIPIGLGFGRTFYGEGENFGVTLYAQPSYLYMRFKGSFSQGNTSVSATESMSEFGATLGTLFNFGAIFLGGGVSLTTIEGSDPVFSLGLGFIVGPRSTR